MIRLLGGGLIGFLLIALWLYCIFDVIATEEVLIRNLPKFVWLMIVLFPRHRLDRVAGPGTAAVRRLASG